MGKGKTPAAPKAETCPSCGGPKRGRGYAHTPTCPNRARHEAGARRSGGGGFSVASLRGLSAQELIAVRKQIDALIADKAPEIKEEIAKLQETLKQIEKT